MVCAGTGLDLRQTLQAEQVQCCLFINQQEKLTGH